MAKTSKFLTRLLIFGFLAIFLIAVLFITLNCEAVVENEKDKYVINNYVYSATYKQDGTMEVTEKIFVEYKDFRHGIFRALPETSDVKIYNPDDTLKFDKKLRIKYQIQSATLPYQYESSNNVLYVRFGSENFEYKPGDTATYTLKYKMTIDERFAPLDVFYFNILGNLWTTNIQNFEGTINFEQPIPNPNTKVFCGEAGSTTTINTFTWSSDQKTLSITASNLDKGEGITVRADLPQNYAKVAENHTTNIIVLIANIIAVFVVFLCFKKGSNKKQIVPVVQFAVNKKYTPADVGYIIDKKVNSEDIASLIIYWAEKGYLKIIEEKKVTYLQKTDKEFEGKVYEKELFGGIFAGKSTADKVDIKKIGVSISEDVAVTKRAIAIENESLFNKVSVFLRTLFIALVGVMQGVTLSTVNFKNVNDTFVFLGVVMGILTMVALFLFSYKADKKLVLSKKSKIITFVLLGLFLAVSLAFAILSFDPYADKFFTVFVSFALVVFACFIIWNHNTRSDEGCEELGDIVGLKNFIEVAEKDRLKMLVEDDPEAFYKIMPYAYVLGVYDTWCKKFESIDVGAPSFYYSDTDFVFSALWFSSIMDATTHSILSSINTANIKNAMDSVGSHVGGGGGFSGGGIGGGGGGSW